MYSIKQALKTPLALLLLWAGLFSLPAIAFAASSLRYSWYMDTNPGWTTEDGWAFGRPTGGGGEFGQPDPTSGHTGLNVYGYNLSGDYEANLPERHLTTGPIDCTGLSNVELRFWRWLDVERRPNDYADISVSNNLTDWTTVLSNPTEVDLTDGIWNPTNVDISSVADGQSTVYIRWTMGPTDFAFNFCGWNIDDVEIWAESAASPPTATTGVATSVSSNSATLNGTVNPNGASTTVAFNYGLTTGYGSTATAAQSPLTGTSSQGVSAQVTGLASKTTYHFRVKAANSSGTGYGSDQTFITTCSGNTVVLQNVTFTSGTTSECVGTTSITVGAGVTIQSGATVTFQAPTVTLQPGFRAENGSVVRIKQQ